MKVRKNAAVLITCALAALVLIDCSGLPPASTKSSAVAILAIDFDKAASRKVFGWYTITIRSAGNQGRRIYVPLDPTVDFQIIKGLQQGMYQITEVFFNYSEYQTQGSASPANISFAAVEGMITFIDCEFQYRVYEDAGKGYMDYEWIPHLSVAKAERILEELKNDKNYSLWRLSEESSALPAMQGLTP
jgi:hypothetical protein